MPTFAYKAKHGPERTLEGELHAESRVAALAALDRLGYSPIWVREVVVVDAARRRLSWRGRAIRPRDVTVLTRQLASLIRSGVRILRALRTIADQTEGRRMQEVVSGVEATIRDGSMLSEALGRHPNLFPPLYLDMVRAGEAGGILDVSLSRLAEAREKDEDARRKVQAALAYPLLVLVVGATAVQWGVGLSPFALTVMVLTAALPSASNVSLLAERMGADNGRIARIILVSTAASFLSFSAAVTLLT